MAVWGSHSIFSVPSPFAQVEARGYTLTFSPSLFSAAYKPLCSARLRNRFPISFLSIIYKSLFSQLLCFVIHPKRWGVASVGLLGGRPGVAPPTPKRRTLRPRRRTRVFFSAIPCLPSAVRCQAQHLSQSPKTRRIISRQPSQEPIMAVAKNSKSQKSANKPNGKPNSKSTGKPKSSRPEPKGQAPLAKNASTKDAQPKPAVPKDNEAQIAVHWKEEEYFHPSPKFIGQANLNDPAMVEHFTEKNFPECFRDYAELLHWDQYLHTTLDASNPPFWISFV